MNKIGKFTFVIFMAIFTWSCTNSEQKTEDQSINSAPTQETDLASTVPDMDYEAMADGLCKCMKPLVDLQNKVNSLEPDEIRAMVDEIDKITQAGDKCIEELEAKYGRVEGKEAEEKADETFKEACPYIAGMISK
ncbi:MAG: hypothetical protein P1U70_25875 [Saprospiraceae bacterium]|jgi:predicted subunit of tRNA(5-methylaminomethyl-2-thiouridylate) methyltransferase|nr:hypothetical protein [Saprospiraceae bacterium]